MNTPYSLPLHPQDQSPLLQLPSEIRSLILSHLLAYPEPLQYDPTPVQFGTAHALLRYEFDWNTFRRANHPNFAGHLHLAILTTCQALHCDGTKVLYSHNTLAVEIEFRMPARAWWFILGEEGPLNSFVLSNFSSILAYVTHRATRQPDPYDSHSRWMYGNVATVLSRMRRFEVSMNGSAYLFLMEQTSDITGQRATLLREMVQFFDEVIEGKVVRLKFVDLVPTDLEAVEAGLGPTRCEKLEIVAGRVEKV